MAEKYRCMNCGFAAPLGASCPRCEGENALGFRFAPPESNRDWFRGYAMGLGYYLAGYRFILDYPRLFKYVAIPLVVNIILFMVLVVGSYFLLAPLEGILDTQWFAWIEWLRIALSWLMRALLLALSLLVGLFLTLFLSTIINAPFYDILSEKVEDLYLGRTLSEPWSFDAFNRMILIPIRESLKMAVFQAGIALGLFLASLLSAGLGTVLLVAAAPYLAALSIFDFVMARKLYNLAEKRSYLKNHFPFALGFGTPVYFLPFLTPFAVAGATLAYLASRRK